MRNTEEPIILKKRETPQDRRRRRMLWVTITLALLAGMVAVAALFGRFLFLHQQPGVGIASRLNGTERAVPPLPLKHPEEQELEQAVDNYIANMSLDDELGQMIQVQFVGPGLGNVLSLPASWRAELGRVHVGSVILYWYNVQTQSQVQALTESLQAPDIAPNIPLLIATDAEGGEVDNLRHIYGYSPTAASLGESLNPQNAYNWGKLDAEHLKSVGINADLAPVVDVKTVSDPSISQRMYSTDPTVVTSMASAFIDGLHSQGMLDTLKHWPGIGWSAVDAHDTLPVSDRSRADLDRLDFAPYKALLSSGKVDMVMSTHVLLTSIDPNMPSSLSPILINGILRQQLGFQGVVITDALYMGALTQKYSMAESAVLAVIAGNDILSSFYNPGGVEQVLAALHHAIDTGLISKARIDQSVKRILLLKLHYGLFTLPG
ncbi:MAG TPA: glycoside hydrolase family 3 N-terminal domain-containing protein [Ktedonobacterales bacterium]|jgi:beta-N-acetylhexosaminidase